MRKTLKVHSANGTDNVDQGLSAEDRSLLDRLVKLWKSDAEHGLKTRHQTGKALNRRLGPPTKRKAHGRRVLEKYGKTLGIAPSELNRMGWLSHLYPNFSHFREQHPEIDSWTKFKGELTNLKAGHGYGARKPAANSSRLATRGIVQAIANLTSKLNRLETPPVGADREKLVAAMRELAKAATRRLKIRIEVAVGMKDSQVETKKTGRVA
jgi:hypothetical protein